MQNHPCIYSYMIDISLTRVCLLLMPHCYYIFHIAIFFIDFGSMLLSLIVIEGT